MVNYSQTNSAIIKSNIKAQHLEAIVPSVPRANKQLVPPGFFLTFFSTRLLSGVDDVAEYQALRYYWGREDKPLLA